jgi:hypothetical protein
MRITAKSRLVLVSLVAVVSAFTVGPATAATGDVALAGTGTISPGLTTTPTPQSFTFSATGDGLVGVQGGAFSCAVSGNDNIGTLAQGAGSITGSCNTPCGTVGTDGTFTRTGYVIRWNSQVTSGCLSGSSFDGSCTLVPTSLPPLVSYLVFCDLVWA